MDIKSMETTNIDKINMNITKINKIKQMITDYGIDKNGNDLLLHILYSDYINAHNTIVSGNLIRLIKYSDLSHRNKYGKNALMLVMEMNSCATTTITKSGFSSNNIIDEITLYDYSWNEIKEMLYDTNIVLIRVVLMYNPPPLTRSDIDILCPCNSFSDNDSYESYCKDNSCLRKYWHDDSLTSNCLNNI